MSCYEIHAKFPPLAPTYEKVRNIKILHFVEKAVKSNKMCRGACEELTQNINNTLDNSFRKQFGISFQESFQKCYNPENKKSPEERRKTKCAIIMETVSKINEDNMSSAGDRVYGSRQSLRVWDADRKNNHLKLYQIIKSVLHQTSLKLKVGLKKQKIM